MLKLTANVDASYNLTPDELKAKVALSDALIVRSATKVRERAGGGVRGGEGGVGEGKCTRWCL